MEPVEPNGSGAWNAANRTPAGFRHRPLIRRARSMYQPTLGRFLSRDPLSATGVDVLTDTGFYSDRLAAMSADPWFYGGNWEHPYVYARNNPGNWEDPSGLQVEKQGYFAFCDEVCAAAAKDPKLNFGGGGILCKDGIQCVCLFPLALNKTVTLTPGQCKTVD